MGTKSSQIDVSLRIAAIFPWIKYHVIIYFMWLLELRTTMTFTIICFASVNRNLRRWNCMFLHSDGFWFRSTSIGDFCIPLPNIVYSNWYALVQNLLIFGHFYHMCKRMAGDWHHQKHLSKVVGMNFGKSCGTIYHPISSL